MKNEQKTPQNEVKEQTSENVESVNALNDMALAVIVQLFGIVKSPIGLVLKKMSEFENVSNFLSAAADADIKTFFDIAAEDKKGDL